MSDLSAIGDLAAFGALAFATSDISDDVRLRNKLQGLRAKYLEDRVGALEERIRVLEAALGIASPARVPTPPDPVAALEAYAAGKTAAP
jgi:hypothetical protein